MAEFLVGSTGFVGGNLIRAHQFDGLFHSTDVDQAYGSKPDLLVYAGVRAEKYLANLHPEEDLQHIRQAFDNICKIDPKQLVLISTIDVLSNPVLADERAIIVPQASNAYGANRYTLEQLVREKYKDAVIIRLPALFGHNLKKNFIYDYIHRIPFQLKKAKMLELVKQDSTLLDYYDEQDNGFYKLRALTQEERTTLKLRFKAVEFDALQFTDSRSVFQFYPLRRLWKDIECALQHQIRLLHTATEPLSAAEIHEALEHHPFVNEIASSPAYYDYRTLYDTIFDGKNGYICDKSIILEELIAFVTSCIE